MFLNLLCSVAGYAVWPCAPPTNFKISWTLVSQLQLDDRASRRLSEALRCSSRLFQSWSHNDDRFPFAQSKGITAFAPKRSTNAGSPGGFPRITFPLAAASNHLHVIGLWVFTRSGFVTSTGQQKLKMLCVRCQAYWA